MTITADRYNMQRTLESAPATWDGLTASYNAVDTQIKLLQDLFSQDLSIIPVESLPTHLAVFGNTVVDLLHLSKVLRNVVEHFGEQDNNPAVRPELEDQSRADFIAICDALDGLLTGSILNMETPIANVLQAVSNASTWMF